MRRRALPTVLAAAVATVVLPAGVSTAGTVAPPVLVYDSNGWHVVLTSSTDALRIFFTGTQLQFQPGFAADTTWTGYPTVGTPSCSQPSSTVVCDTTDGRVEVTALDGDDVVTAADSAVTLTAYGDPGDDQLTAGTEPAYLVGFGGTDTLTGGPAADRLAGGVRADVLRGDAAADALFGGAGDDYLSGGDGADDLFGGDDADQFFGDGGADHLKARDGNRDQVLDCGAGDNDLETAPRDKIDPDPISC